MPATTMQARKVARRAAFHEAAFDREQSPWAALRRAQDWVMSEARRLDSGDVAVLAEDIRAVARMLNERSRA